MNLAAVVGLFLVLAVPACDAECPAGNTTADVHGWNRGGYVCLPGPAATAAQPSAGASSSPSAQSAAGAKTPTPSTVGASGCATVAASDSAVVMIVPKDGPAAVATTGDAPPPSLSYVLVQASFYGGDAGAAPGLRALRGSLDVAGAKLVLGFAATVTGPVESFTLAFASGTLTEVCASQPGPIATAVLPGGDGSTRPARVLWNANTAVLTLLVTASAGSFEFLFSPA